MKRKKTLLAILSLMMLIVILPITSCAEKEPTTQEDMQALLKESADNMKSTKYLSTSSNGSFNVEIPQLAKEAGLEVGTITGDLTMTTSQNTSDNETEMKLNASVNMGGSVSMKIAVEYWYVNGWSYFHFNIPFAGDKWGKTNKPIEQTGELTNSFEGAFDTFLEKLQLEYLGKEDIKGISSYHVNIVPTEASIKAIIESIAENTGGTSTDVTEIFNNETFKTVMNKVLDALKLEVWIDTKAKLVSQFNFGLDLELSHADIEELPADSGNIKALLNITLNLQAPAAKITITPPEEALNAEEINPEDFGSLFNN